MFFFYQVLSFLHVRTCENSKFLVLENCFRSKFWLKLAHRFWLENPKVSCMEKSVESATKVASVTQKISSYPGGVACNQISGGAYILKIIDLPGGRVNDPLSGKRYSLPFVPATPSSPSRTLETLFELTRRL